jgi:hypothetical protein
LSTQTGDYTNTAIEGTRIAAGWTAAAAVGGEFAEVGATVGFALGGPVGSALLGVGLGAIGGGLGYFGASTVVTNVANYAQNHINPNDLLYGGEPEWAGP